MVICIYCSASDTIKKEYKDSIYNLSYKLGKEGNSLVFGAGTWGLMGAAARGFKDAGAKVHGVIPQFFEDNGYEGLFTLADEITRTKTMAERKTIMENSSDAFIIAPGGVGTLEEFFEAVTLKKLGRHKKAIVVYNIGGFYNKLKEFCNDMVDKEFLDKRSFEMFTFLDTEEEVINYLKNYSSNSVTWNYLKKD